MWRGLAGLVAGLALAAAAMLVFSGRARTIDPLPAAPRSLADTAQDAPLPEAVPEATARTREEKRFGRYDKDRDGTIAREEYLTPRRKAFARLDRNGDGALQFDEWAGKTLTKFAAADRDRSGGMSAAEFATTAVKRKQRIRCAPAAPAAEEG